MAEPNGHSGHNGNNGRTPVRQINEKLADIETHLMGSGLEPLLDPDKYSADGTPERAYFEHGYATALRDVLRMMKSAA
jgi:hypothetical protein